jgi:hypothetical protein
MTVTTENTFKAYDGNASTVTFSIDFQFWDDDEIEVYLRVEATGVETLQIETTDYALTHPVAGLTGSITFITPPPDTVRVYIRRNSKVTQQKDISPSTVLPSAAIEEALDRLALRFQEANHDFSVRAMLTPVTDEDLDMTLPNAVDRGITGAQLGFDSDGLPLITVATLDTALTTAFSETLLDDSDAVAARATLLLDSFVTKESAATVSVVSTEQVLNLTGSTRVDNILGAVEGQRLIVFWAGAATFDIGDAKGGDGAISLSTSNNLTGHTGGKTLTLVSNGTTWFEVARSTPPIQLRSPASNASIAVTAEDTVLSITGANAIENFTGGVLGQRLTILWAAAATFNITHAIGTDGEINLGTETDITNHTAGDVLELIFDGTDWFERGRSTQRNARRTLTASGEISVTSRDSLLYIDGNTLIDNIIGGQAGQRITIQWETSALFDIGDAAGGPGQIHLAGNQDITNLEADHSLDLIHDGDDWFETGRSTNPGNYRSLSQSAAVTVDASDRTILLTNTSAVTSIVNGFAGQHITFVWGNSFQMTDGGNLKLVGHFNKVADDTISLVCDGTNWFETSRSDTTP